MAEMTYRMRVDNEIRELILKFECQPILFIGSGISRRYIGAPNWTELLQSIFERFPDGKNLFEYNRQKFRNNMIDVGEALSDLVFEWAWREGRSAFPQEMFGPKSTKDGFLKYLCCEHIKNLTNAHDQLEKKLAAEIEMLSAIKPHAIITTNYDLFLESIFSGYETITGQKILRYNTNSFGEIYHIHGDVSESNSIVLTRSDYNDWSEKKKYISAKLLAYFAEHPVFIMGYSVNDPNVQSILLDIGELVADEEGLIENVYQIIWRQDEIEKNPPEQATVSYEGKEFRTMAIHTSDFEWVYKALQSQSALTSINPKLVRSLAARMMRLVRHDIPSGSVAVDYDVLERVASDTAELPKLLGITFVENPNQSHPFTLSQVATRLKLDNWQAANKILNQIKSETGIDLRSTDNRYHCKIKTGTKETSSTRKWSHETIDLFRKVIKGDSYTLNI